MAVETPSCRLLSWGLSHVGYVRTRNEDAVLDMPEAGLWAVADGMGGHARGDVASRCVVEALHALGESYAGLPLLERLAPALQQVNAELQALAATFGPAEIVGTTVAVLVLEGERYHCLWAGDSRIYLWRGGELSCLTRDHTERAEREGRVTHALTRAVGAESYLELDYVQGFLYEEDCFVLCTDGATKVLSDARIARLIEEATPHGACDALLSQALQAGGPDNVSCVSVYLPAQEGL